MHGLTPLGRAVKWRWLRWVAELRAALPVGRVEGPVNFIVGCGRSGTTILGQLTSLHPDVTYLNEPVHYWFAVDPRTDYSAFFSHPGTCWIEASEADAGATKRFERVFGQAQGDRTLVEKLPINSLRMGWLDRISPGSRFVHIVRDCRAVAASVNEIDRVGAYRFAGRNLHMWWGTEHHKWKTLAREGAGRGLFREALAAIGGEDARDPWHMATYEWLVSLEQIWRSRDALALGEDRYLEIRYEQLLQEPEPVMREVERFLGLPPDAELPAAAAKKLRPRTEPHFSFSLPGAMHDAFSEMQRRLGYPIDGVHRS